MATPDNKKSTGLVTVLAAIILVAACSGSGGAGGSQGSSPGQEQPPSGGGGSTGASIGGGNPGNAGAPGNGGAPANGGGIGGPPIGGVGAGSPKVVVPRHGLADLRDASPSELTSRIDGSGHVIVRVRWWGGVEPCDVLDSVVVDRTGSSFVITVRIGTPPGPRVACIEIAQDTATLVDLGVLPAGSYTVRASKGDAPPLTIAVP